MPSVEISSLLIDYWFRILLCVTFSIDDISKIISQFAEEHEEFDASLTHPRINIADDNQTISIKISQTDSGQRFYRFSAFGAIVAVPGRKYHWKLQTKKKYLKFGNILIGVIEAEQCKDTQLGSWWGEKFGYVYGPRGILYNGSSKIFGYGNGKKYATGDCFDIWLDLKDGNSLSFGKNDGNFGKAFDMRPDTNYRLGVGMRGYNFECELSIVSFEVDY